MVRPNPSKMFAHRNFRGYSISGLPKLCWLYDIILIGHHILLCEIYYVMKFMTEILLRVKGNGSIVVSFGITFGLCQGRQDNAPHLYESNQLID